MEFVPEQGALSETWRTSYESRGKSRAFGCICRRFDDNVVCCHGRGSWTRRSYGFASGELLGARHWQYGYVAWPTFSTLFLTRVTLDRGPGQVRDPRTTETMVRAVAGGKNSLSFRYDGTVWYVHIRISVVVSLTKGVPVSSSDATNIRTSIKQEGNEIVINGRKWCVYNLKLPSRRSEMLMGY